MGSRRKLRPNQCYAGFAFGDDDKNLRGSDRHQRKLEFATKIPEPGFPPGPHDPIEVDNNRSR